MVMSWIWSGMMVLSLVCGVATGRGEAVARGAMEGAQAGLELVLSMGGMVCLWSGVMEVMDRCGLAEKLARGMTPVLGLLFRTRDPQIRGAIAANISANLLGLGNAATPLGLRAMEGLRRESPERTSDDMCTLVVCNTASLQLIPTTVGAVRLAAGCQRPFDILPAVWLTSAVALGAGLGMSRLLRRGWRA